MIRDGTFARRARYWASHVHQATPSLEVPGRGADPDVVSMRPMPFRLEKDSFAAFSERARRLRVTPFTLCASAIFRSLREITAQDHLLLGVIANTRRRPFERAVGQFANVYMIRHDLGDAAMADAAVKEVGQEVTGVMQRYVPYDSFADQVSWMRERQARGFAVTDVNVDFLPPVVEARKYSSGGEYMVSPFWLTQRVFPSTVPYHGVVLSFAFLPEDNALSGWVNYEASIVDQPRAEAVCAALTGALSQDR
jgi:hypothetical protein